MYDSEEWIYYHKSFRSDYEQNCTCINLTKTLQKCPPEIPDSDAVAFYELNCQCEQKPHFLMGHVEEFKKAIIEAKALGRPVRSYMPFMVGHPPHAYRLDVIVECLPRIFRFVLSETQTIKAKHIAEELAKADKVNVNVLADAFGKVHGLGRLSKAVLRAHRKFIIDTDL